ncbi:hypothetical protein K437DRAFT_29512 [Tilletiaria anomala UBC 951]|uniref:Uncharacterized protein n=1 Tax=Tilletiaria anomala (strain ATCC 24038 / CBS 436.72 / UBC 951) TaxID=1037660 RepID=A0A066V9I5_TILAU|nr:uncharacterized protein K437DRAFT_29512 [Tilletiaria anomala UBC 951]KDN38151.1 hypothetical protein K437DRAFT_29512 [Tilletiaria anomala UBC 951]
MDECASNCCVWREHRRLSAGVWRTALHLIFIRAYIFPAVDWVGTMESASMYCMKDGYGHDMYSQHR